MIFLKKSNKKTTGETPVVFLFWDLRACVKIKKEDISKLPMENVDEIVLVDADIHLKKSLMVSSEKKPIEITITGFARKCDGINLTSIKYKEGIFGIE